MDRDFQAAMIILDSPTLRGRVERHCNIDTERISPSILRNGWSSGERKLIELALSLTSASRKVNLFHHLDGIDAENARRVLKALSVALCGHDLTDHNKRLPEDRYREILSKMTSSSPELTQERELF